MTDGDFKAIAARTDLFSGATPLVTLHGETTILARSADITVLGAAENYGEVRKNLRVLKGRFLDADDVREIAKVCVVSRHLYEALDQGDGIETVKTLGMSLRVVGEFEEPVDTLGRGEVTPDTIFVPITVSWYFIPAHNVDTVFAEVKDLGSVPTATEAISSLLKERHRPGSRYSVESMATVLKVANAISIGLLIVFVLVAAISVVVGGVGIMNIMLASVEQRTREIGLRRSLGARRRDILAQFLFEAALLGAFGSGLGVLLGALVPLVARPFVHEVAIPVSLPSLAFAFLFSAGVTLLCGLVPAYRAAFLDPVEALRHE
jgi:putative ABC transport system permease protein